MTAGSRLLPRPCVHSCGSAVFTAMKAPTPTGQAPKWIPFEAGDRNPAKDEAVRCWVIVGAQAWRPTDLVEHLMTTREISEEKARELAGGYPWHRPHTCIERGDAA